MKIINENLKEKLAKGIMLVTISGALIAKNPVASNNGNTVVYAAETLESKQSKALKNLEKVYKYYSKSYYTEKEYTKLTKYYNKGVKAIKACKTKTSITETYNEYKELLNSVKPSILVKYQKKLEKSLLKSYKSLISKNVYSDDSLEELQILKKEGVEKIYACKTKSKSKKAKSSYVALMKDVDTLLEETRLDVVNYILDSKNLSKNEKQAVVEQINNLETVEDIISIGEEYGYGETKKIEGEVITVEQIESKIKELCKKYPKYSEFEIRLLVATANMDFVKEEDILTIFNVNSKKELEDLYIDMDYLMTDINECIINEMAKNTSVTMFGRTYEDRINMDEIFINEKLKNNMSYILKLSKIMIDDPQNYPSACANAELELLTYCTDSYDGMEDYNFKYGFTYKYNDPIFDGTGAGYITKDFLSRLTADFLTFDIISKLPEGWDTLNKMAIIENPYESVNVKTKK